jgi:hypothetical protein
MILDTGMSTEPATQDPGDNEQTLQGNPTAEVWLASPGILSTRNAFISPTPSYSCFKTRLGLPFTILQARENAPAGQSGSSSELHL